MSATSPVPDAAALADPLAEARRLVARGQSRGVVLRLLGGVAVYVRAPGDRPRLPRPIRDIDFVTARGCERAVDDLLGSAGYVPGPRRRLRRLYSDVAHGRTVDVFLGAFSMCHALPIADRLHLHPLTLPLAELLLTKLQIVELRDRDERDILSLVFHHPVAAEGAGAIEPDVIAALCARDWGLWRTCHASIDRCIADLANYDLSAGEAALVAGRLHGLWACVEAASKTSKWRMRHRVGDRVRWYEEPADARRD